MIEIQVAIYARVSCEQQTTDHTIESQLTALRERVAVDELVLSEELQFIDEGYSGATKRGNRPRQASRFGIELLCGEC